MNNKHYLVGVLLNQVAYFAAESMTLFTTTIIMTTIATAAMIPIIMN